MEALDSLYAIDAGCTGVLGDAFLRRRCLNQLRDMSGLERRTFIANFLNEYFLNEKVIAQGYGPADAYEFLRWINEEMDCLYDD
jgi:hypothetical protein